jgi:hypothetical protein
VKLTSIPRGTAHTGKDAWNEAHHIVPQPATCLHCGESHPASYRGCKICQ